MSTRQLLTIEYVRQALRYENGKLFWLTRPLSHFPDDRARKSWNSKNAGKEAGYCSKLRNELRWAIGLAGNEYHRARLVWMFHYGVLPNLVDHENRNTLDDRVENLRIATKSQNAANSKRPVNNTSSYKGVNWRKDRNKWRARITANGKEYHLGLFDYPKTAHEAYCKAATFHHGNFAHGG